MNANGDSGAQRGRHFHPFESLPAEIQVAIWEAHILAEACCVQQAITLVRYMRAGRVLASGRRRIPGRFSSTHDARIRVALSSVLRRIAWEDSCVGASWDCADLKRDASWLLSRKSAAASALRCRLRDGRFPLPSKGFRCPIRVGDPPHPCSGEVASLARLMRECDDSHMFKRVAWTSPVLVIEYPHLRRGLCGGEEFRIRRIYINSHRSGDGSFTVEDILALIVAHYSERLTSEELSRLAESARGSGRTAARRKLVLDELTDSTTGASKKRCDGDFIGTLAGFAISFKHQNRVHGYPYIRVLAAPGSY